MKRLLVEKYGLVDSDLEHEIDRNLDYHENLDNILAIHGLADEVTRYEVERQLELIERQLEIRFDVGGTETKLRHIGAKPLVTDLVRDDRENRFEKVFEKYFDLFYSERLVPASNLADAARKIVGAKPKLEEKVTEKLLDIAKSRHKHKDITGADAIESFDKLWCALLEEEEYFRRDELVRKDVYDAKAKKVGTVADIGYSKEGKIALILRPATISNVKKLSDKDLVLSHLAGDRYQTVLFDRILEIGDIILLKADSVADVRQEPVAITSSPSQQESE